MDRSALSFADGSFASPQYVPDLNLVPPEFRNSYQRNVGSGGYKRFCLRPEVWKEIEPLVLELERTEREAAESIAQADAKLAAAKLARLNEGVSAALSTALAVANVPDMLIRGAIALIQETNKFQLDENYDDETIVVADTPTGLMSVNGLVDTFLESQEGEGFRPKKTAPSDGFFASMIAEMKQRR